MKLTKNAKGQYTGSCCFTEKPEDIKVLIADNKFSEFEGTDKEAFVIEKIIDLSPLNYKDFSMELLFDKDFIGENNNLMEVDDQGIWHCILVRAKSTAPENMDGILIQSEGYSYARYASLLSNTEL